ncbi:hypothetical protein LSAT2_030378, partial [Lamellibrachia satsuma]
MGNKYVTGVITSALLKTQQNERSRSSVSLQTSEPGGAIDVTRDCCPTPQTDHSGKGSPDVAWYRQRNVLSPQIVAVKIVLNGTSGFAVPLRVITADWTAITGKGTRFKEYG